MLWLSFAFLMIVQILGCYAVMSPMKEEKGWAVVNGISGFAMLINCLFIIPELNMGGFFDYYWFLLVITVGSLIVVGAISRYFGIVQIEREENYNANY
jgi:peptidoglycan/LPS O-acetylase OafA/YrhL